jgi:hypothetical protein
MIMGWSSLRNTGDHKLQEEGFVQKYSWLILLCHRGISTYIFQEDQEASKAKSPSVHGYEGKELWFGQQGSGS